MPPPTATGPNGEKVMLQNGQWVPLQNGVLERGNIDLTSRPVVRNSDGSISTVRSMSANIDNVEVLLPTVSDDGKLLSNEEAIELYRRTGRHLGKFIDPDSATRYAEQLHRDQERLYSGGLAAAAPRIGALPGRPTAAGAEQDSMTRQGLKTAAAEFVANMIGLPHAAGDVLALTAAGLRTGAGAAKAAMTGEPIDLANRFDRAREYEERVSYAGMLRSLPNPSGDDVLRAIGAEPAESEIAASAGKTAADVATMMTLKPAARLRELINTRRGAQASAAAERRELLLSRERGASLVDEKTRSAVDEAAKNLLRGTGRAAEAGFEGALVGALGEGDPAKTAAWSAGIQSAGSAALSAKGWIWKNPGKAALSLWLGHEMYRAVAPGPQDAFESKDEVIRELVASYGLGMVAALAGAGRPVRQIPQTLSTASRHAIASVVTQLQEAESRGDPVYERVIARFAEDPDYFGKEARMRLQLAATRERPNALLTEIDSLMQSNRFRAKVESLTSDESERPVMRTGGGF